MGKGTGIEPREPYRGCEGKVETTTARYRGGKSRPRVMGGRVRSSHQSLPPPFFSAVRYTKHTHIPHAPPYARPRHPRGSRDG
eukprot:scaffold20072_cov88-Isochrysis_galbana.AAC.1